MSISFVSGEGVEQIGVANSSPSEVAGQALCPAIQTISL